MDVVQKVLNLVVCTEELYCCIDGIHPHISEMFKEFYAHLKLTVDSVPTLSTPNDSTPLILDNTEEEIKLEYVFSYLHDHLNIGKWSEVSQNKRQAFSAICFLKSCVSIKDGSISNLRNSLSYLDKGYLMGLPLTKNVTLLTDCAKIVSECVTTLRGVDEDEFKSEVCLNKSTKRKRTEYDSYIKLNGTEIRELVKPSLEEFSKKHFDQMFPAKIKNCMAHWPALTKWLDIKYILDKAGERTVPIELGSYAADNFSQKLMTVKDYVKRYYLEENGKVGYLAQHDLLTQIPELKEDISIPDYCLISRNLTAEDSELEPEICAWFGPKNTVSALHFDPKDNLLCQVYGIKQIVLFDPKDSQYLYPHSDVILSNTAQVDPVLPNLIEYPGFAKAKMFKCLLKGGDMLYIPPKWWHHVTAMEKSFSINFWWQ